MGTTMNVWQVLRSFALVMPLIAGICATTVTGCGGGGGGNTNGELCQQCGDSDGQCLVGTFIIADNEQRPNFCPENGDCMYELHCLRKLDSAQRRCFPADPTTHAVDILYRCDGARPNPSIAPTITPIPNPTLTASATPTPTSTGPTATGSTATPTSSAATPTESAPTPTATPGEVTVDITIDNPDDVSASSVTATVKYPSSKGSFLKDNATDCPSLDDGLTAHDDGGGTLMLRFPGNPTDAFPINASCTFHQIAGQTLVGTDLTPSVDPTQLTIEIGSLS